MSRPQAETSGLGVPGLKVEEPGVLRPPAEAQDLVVPGPEVVRPGITPEADPEDEVALEEKILAYIGHHGQANTGELAKALGVTTRAVNYCQQKLLSEGRLERAGKGRATVYKLRETPKG